MNPRILITGAAGNVGRKLCKSINDSGYFCLATDIGEFTDKLTNVKYSKLDITSDEDLKQIEENKITHIVHLATILPRNGITRETEYRVDVGGTKKLLSACTKYNVEKLILTTSGASYGYHSDSSFPLKETDKIRGNHVFGYSFHKRLIEQYVSYYREQKNLDILLFRPSTILGDGMKTPISELLEKKTIIDIKGSLFPFSFVWDEDVVGFIMEGIETSINGSYNLCGDGFISTKELAKKYKKIYIAIPALIIQFALRILSKLKLTQYGPDQIDFLRYRPALDNSKSKKDFNYQYKRTTVEALANFL